MAEYDSFTSLLFDSAQGEFDRSDVVLKMDPSSGSFEARILKGGEERVLGNFPLVDTFKEMLDNAGFKVIIEHG